MKTFDDLVDHWVQTSFAAPDIREVTLRDGRIFYTRFRNGVIRLQRDDDDDPAPVVLHHGGSMDGVLDTDEWKDLFLELARLHPAIDTVGSTEMKELLSAAEAAITLLHEMSLDPFWHTPVTTALLRRLRKAVAPFDPTYS